MITLSYNGFFSFFPFSSENERFEADKAQVVKEIAELKPKEIRGVQAG